MGAEVIVVGAGPVGLVLAGELAVAGTSVEVLERRAAPDTTIKAGGVALPVVAALRRRGLLPALDERSQHELARIAGFFPALARQEDGRYHIPTRAGHFAALELDRGLVDGTDPDIAAQDRLDPLLPVPQADLEALLAEWVAGLGVVVRRGTAVTGVADRGDHVVVSTDGGDVETGWLVGCDGGRSGVRAAMGVDFPGTDAEITGRQAVVDLAHPEALPRGWQRTPTGVFVHGPFPGRILTVEFDGPPADRDAPVEAAELQAALRRVSGVDVVVEAVHTATRWTDNARQATSYRRGRLLLAGDAAHVHSPFGGQGLNLGMGDAVNLGWKLAAVAAGAAPEGLLDTYTAERHPVGAAVLEWTRAQVALMRPDPKTSALRDVVARLLANREGMTEVVGVVGGLRTVTPLEGVGAPGTHRLVGRLAPDLRLADGTRLGDHGRSGGALLATAASVRSVEGVDLEHVLIAADETRGAAALLVRPDGLVAWAVDDPAGVDEVRAVVDRCHLAGGPARGGRVRREPIG